MSNPLLRSGEQARAGQDTELMHSRALWVYLCFAVWGIYVASFAVVAFVAPDWSEVLGLLSFLPALIGLIGLIIALTAWSVRRVRLLLVATLVMALAIVCSFMMLPDSWLRASNLLLGVAVVGYGLFVLVTCALGLRDTFTRRRA